MSLPLSLWLRSRLVGGPLEHAAGQLRWLSGYGHRLHHPELRELHQEGRLLPQVLSKLLKPDSCCADGGSHIGSFLALLRQYAPRGEHVAFEPSPTKCAWLRQRFKGVTVVEGALGEVIGRAYFKEDESNPGFSKLVDERSGYPVRVYCLDALPFPFDFIKLDVEGHELHVLRGAKKLIETNKPSIILECGPEPAIGENARRNLFEYVTRDMDYDLLTFADFLFDKGPIGYDEFRRAGIYPFRAFNFVALPRVKPPAQEKPDHYRSTALNLD